MLKVLFASSEAVPYIKTGGLADVSGSLVAALIKRRVDARLMLPLYRQVKRDFDLTDTGHGFDIQMSGTTHRVRILKHAEHAYFLDCDT